MTKRISFSRLLMLASAGCLMLGACIAETEPDTLAGHKAVTPSTATAGGDGARCGFGTAAARCSAGFFCSPVSRDQGVCRGLSGEGQRCGAGNKPLCTNGLVCSAKPGGEGVCRARVTLGKACEGANPPCVQGLSCDMTTASHTCQRGG